MRILIVQNVWDSEGFASGGVFDGENFGLRAKKNVSQEDPPKMPEGPPSRQVGEECFAQCAKRWPKSGRVPIDPVLPQKNNDYHANPHNPKRLIM